MFIDEVEIYIRSGDGGAGRSSFLREKFRPHGGPDGGDGGDGGDVFFTASRTLNTLIRFRHKRKFNAESGEPGRGKDMFGKRGENIVIEVPIGTTISDLEGTTLFDLDQDGTTIKLLKGGKGGLGNANFATSTKQAPTYAQPGLPGEEGQFKLELKMLADVGLVGLPNAGKSTLLKALTSAKPKIAAYPFTTLSPNLGVLKGYDKELVIADIPGLIEGAHEGIGLGVKFLKHIERTTLLIHMVDVISETMEEDIKTIENELNSFSDKLLNKKRILVLNKIDSISPERKEELQKQFPEALLISAITQTNLESLIKIILKIT